MLVVAYKFKQKISFSELILDIYFILAVLIVAESAIFYKDTKNFRVDRPFIVALMHKNLVLFAGRLNAI